MVQISQVAKPAPGGHELLVKVHATTVNRTDCHYRSGRPWIMRPLLSGLARPRAPVLGNEFAGQAAWLRGDACLARLWLWELPPRPTCG